MQPAEPKKKATAAPARPETEKEDGNENTEEAQEQSKLYRMVMTPVNLISFVLGLWLVDLRYRLRRARDHPHPPTASFIKLMRMEASEAFRLRNRVVVGLALAALFVLWATSWATRCVVAWLVA
ncbi:hypothetical protein PG996_002513 [Apiospora saccharicola]|uniref:Uncharacterized protein n=1 Tax=Apiospora saccharicola TaxID=335842 RepID=A0ABR1WJR6_9PEZI